MKSDTLSSGKAHRTTAIPRLTVNNFHHFPSRAKKLPPDANTAAACNTKLFQFKEKMCFGCAKCRRDNIQSDTIAVNLRERIVLCTMCFTRIIRPRTYRPSRAVPFPSLLSWLDYKPVSKSMPVSEDISERVAEAVLPSGDRVADPLLITTGDIPTRFNALPSIATRSNDRDTMKSMNSRIGGGTVDMNAGCVSTNRKHPCIRVWGVCEHGPSCLFREAPEDLCIAYLMGLCDGKPSQCILSHQDIYDLPPSDPHPSVARRATDLGSENTYWHQWVSDRKKSLNNAEWQLWNNGSVEVLLDRYAPALKEEKVEQDETVDLCVSDILSALRNIDS